MKLSGRKQAGEGKRDRILQRRMKAQKKDKKGKYQCKQTTKKDSGN